MEKLKPLSEITQPDERNLMFVRIDTGEPLTLDEHHASVADIVLGADVPEEVRSYFASVQNIYLYSWFAYDLYPVVEFLCSTAIELALRKRLPLRGNGEDKRTLGPLLEQANKQKLIKEKGFSHMREIRQNIAERLRVERQIIKVRGPALPKRDYGRDLSEHIRFLRNYFAHPRIHTIVVPGETLSQLRLTAEFINQLFAR